MDKTKHSSITAIIPLYNQGKYVEEALNSIFNQTHKIDEIIVVNDGSTDNGLAVISEYKDKIRIINKLNSGTKDAVSEGLKYATGDFISFLDADDRWVKNKTELQFNLLSQNSSIHMVFGCAQRFIMDTMDKNISEKIIDVLPGITRTGGLFRREVFEKVKYDSPTFKVHEFIDWFNRVVEEKFNYINHVDIVFERRIHDQNTGIINKETQRQQYFYSIKASLDRRRANENK